VSTVVAAPAVPRMHPADLGLRLAVEVGALAGTWWSVAHLVGGPAGAVAGAVAAVLAASAWVTFATLDDPSRSGRAPVPVSGRTRLLLEAVVLLGPVAGLLVTDQAGAGLVLGAAVALHQVTGRARLRWMWSRPSRVDPHVTGGGRGAQGRHQPR
jgi:hypothetical protein